MGVTSFAGRFFKWAAGSDFYSHTELANNWENLDAIIGGSDPSWPPVNTSQKDQGGLYAQIQGLRNDLPLGSCLPWMPTPSSDPVDATTFPALLQSATSGAWVVCDGSTITDHDWGGGPFVVPDMVGCYVVGADPSLARGTIPAQSAGFAPGAVKDSSTGQFGSNDVADVPTHFHTMDHIHETGGIAGVETGISGDPDPDDDLNTSFQNPFVTVATGGSVEVARRVHAHQGKAIYSSLARANGSQGQRVKDVGGSDPSQTIRHATTVQQIKTGGDTTDPTGAAVGDSSNTLAVDARPQSVGLIWIMKVKKAVVPS